MLPRRAVLAAAGCAALVVAGATVARADTTPTDTTSTPTPTVTAPDAAPTPVPKPDPGPVRTTPPPRRVVAPPVKTVRSAPVPARAVTPVYRPRVTKVLVTPKLRSVPKAHKRRVHRLAPKHRKASRPAQKPSVVPAATTPKPKPRAPKTSTTVSANAPRASSRRWTTAAGASLGVLALTGLIVGVMRRPSRSAPEPLAEPTPAPAPPSRPVPPAPATNGASHEPVTEELRPLELLVAAPEPEPITPPSERCSIAWWRGYVRSQFIAYAESRDGGVIVAESPSFAWRSSKPPPQTDDALAAHTRLLEQLSKLGWEAEASGPDWFEFTFQRAPAGRPSLPEVPVS